MRHELTRDQAVAIALLRQRHPRADVQVQRTISGVIVEARDGGVLVETLRADYRAAAVTGPALHRAA